MLKYTHTRFIVFGFQFNRFSFNNLCLHDLHLNRISFMVYISVGFYPHILELQWFIKIISISFVIIKKREIVSPEAFHPSFDDD